MNDFVLTLADGRSLGYAEYGDPSGRPVLAFIGTGSRRFYPFDLSIAAALGVRLITVERPGIGLSTIQPNRTLLDWPADIAQLADALQLDRFGIVGVGAGGPYGLACAYRLTERVARLGLVSAFAPPGVGGVPLIHRFTPLMARYTERRAERSHTWIRTHPVKAYQKFHHSLPDCDVLVVRELGPRYLKPSFMRDTYDELYRQGLEGPIQDELLLTRPWGFEPGAVQVPTLLWHGEADTKAPPRMGRLLAKMIEGCRAHFLPNEGHLIYLKHWQEILVALRGE
jgi:pimeloyl-ACP methyl ester carboxylesterase